jgi:hypothetical protein
MEGLVFLQFTARGPWIILTMSAGFHLTLLASFVGLARNEKPGVASSLNVNDGDFGQ